MVEANVSILESMFSIQKGASGRTNCIEHLKGDVFLDWFNNRVDFICIRCKGGIEVVYNINRSGNDITIKLL